jgi:acyl-CoA dehydrogenase
VKRKTEGLSLFYTKLDRAHIEHQLIPKMGRHAVGSNMLFITDLFIPEEDRIGEEGQGFKILLKGLNPERVMLGAEAVGVGPRSPSRSAARYARERVVFGRPIGQNQGIQHPLAKAWMQVEAANLMVFKAAHPVRCKGEECGVEANSAKYLAAEAGFEACQTAVMSMGGMGYAQGISCRALFARSVGPAHCPGQPAPDHEHRRTGSLPVLNACPRGALPKSVTDCFGLSTKGLKMNHPAAPPAPGCSRRATAKRR